MAPAFPIPNKGDSLSPPIQSRHGGNALRDVSGGFSGRTVARLIPDRPPPPVGRAGLGTGPSLQRSPKISVGPPIQAGIAGRYHNADSMHHNPRPSEGNFSPSRPGKGERKSPKALDGYVIGSSADPANGGTHFDVDRQDHDAGRDGGPLDSVQQTQRRYKGSLAIDGNTRAKTPRGSPALQKLPTMLHHNTSGNGAVIANNLGSLTSPSNTIYDMDYAWGHNTLPAHYHPDPSERNREESDDHVVFPFLPARVYTPRNGRDGNVSVFGSSSPRNTSAPPVPRLGGSNQVSKPQSRKRVSSRQNSKKRPRDDDPSKPPISEASVSIAVDSRVGSSPSRGSLSRSAVTSALNKGSYYVQDDSQTSVIITEINMWRGYIVMLSTVQALVALFAFIGLAGIVAGECAHSLIISENRWCLI